MIRSNYRTLEQRPHVLKRVGVGKTLNVLLVSVAYAHMDRVVIRVSNIAAMFIGRNNFGFFGKFSP